MSGTGSLFKYIKILSSGAITKKRNQCKLKSYPSLFHLFQLQVLDIPIGYKHKGGFKSE